MYLGNVDVEVIPDLVTDMEKLVAEHKGKPSVATAIYALLCLTAEAMTRNSDLTLAFRQMLCRGYGDIVADMLEKSEAIVAEEEEAAEAIPIPPNEYTERVTPDEQIFTIDQFQELVDDGTLASGDGHGQQAVKTETDVHWRTMHDDYTVKPTKKFKKDLLPSTTHVVWYNK